MNNRLLSLLLFSLVTLSGCATAEPFMPSHLTARNVGRWFGSYTVVLDGNTLAYKKISGDTERVENIRPTTAQWKAFRKELDEIDVWHWRKEYADEDILDGNVWQFEVEYSDRAIKTAGHEVYPLKDGSPSKASQPTEQYKRYLTALRTLLGGREFCCD